ncbi:MAG: hypothetical protein J7M01_03675 [Candidatus Marinimicrobia bacterium]|nr:hypothetical protein [Candidatus Neomarinimicrobiota bacterium]
MGNENKEVFRIKKPSAQKNDLTKTKSSWLIALLILFITTGLLTGSYLLIRAALNQSYHNQSLSIRANVQHLFFNINNIKSSINQLVKMTIKQNPTQQKNPKQNKLNSKNGEPGKKKTATVKKLFNIKHDKKVSKNWPKLALTGLGQTKGQSVAIINGQSVALNEYIEGAKLIAVREKDVVLEYDGERKILSLQSLNK